jgi:hypothetical protein
MKEGLLKAIRINPSNCPAVISFREMVSLNNGLVKKQTVILHVMNENNN